MSTNTATTTRTSAPREVDFLAALEQVTGRPLAPYRDTRSAGQYEADERRIEAHITNLDDYRFPGGC